MQVKVPVVTDMLYFCFTINNAKGKTMFAQQKQPSNR